jgi:hypothetical protein
MQVFLRLLCSPLRSHGMVTTGVGRLSSFASARLRRPINYFPQPLARKYLFLFQKGAFPFQGLQTGFKYNESSTWRQIGIYDLILESQLNYTGNGLYGLDTVGLMVDGNATFENQVVAGIATKAYYLGIFGLGPKPSNFSNFENPQPSLMQTMKNQEVIPSVSFAYTAGASYRQYHPCKTECS